MTKYRINVTARDIELGRPRNLYCCPVARAVRRHKSLVRFLVGSTWLVVYPKRKPDRGHYLKLAPEVSSFIAAFDARKDVEPFTFTLVVP